VPMSRQSRPHPPPDGRHRGSGDGSREPADYGWDQYLLLMTHGRHK
jgi:hypothetical protein